MTLPQPNILLIDDDYNYLQSMAELLELNQLNPIISQEPAHARRLIKKHDIDLILLDLKMPDMDGLTVLKNLSDLLDYIPVIMISGEGDIKQAVSALKIGAFDYIEKGEDVQTIIQAIQNGLKKRASQIKVPRPSVNANAFPTIIYKSSAMETIMQMVLTISKRDINVLISGESGTGKELVAKALHYQSSRRNGPIIAVNCANFQETLLESELFGYKKGAFTGAYQDKQGKIAAADRGTLFLDEIGEIPIGLQAKLLRVLQEKEITPIGSSQTKKVDFRLIAATNRNLKEMMQANSFREDLYYRLNTINLYLPPLRQRLEDIEPLVNFYMDWFSNQHQIPPKTISNDVLSIIKQYDWPGNIRELRNFVENLIIFVVEDYIDLTNLTSLLNNAMRHHPLLKIVKAIT